MPKERPFFNPRGEKCGLAVKSASGELRDSTFGPFPAHGYQNIELDALSSSGIYQDLTTIPGATYELRFAFEPDQSPLERDNLPT